MARIFLLLTALFSIGIPLSTRAAERYLVQASSASAAHRDVIRVGATVEQNLPIVNGVAARLSASQAERLRATTGVRVFADRTLRTSASLLSTLTNTTEKLVSTTL